MRFLFFTGRDTACTGMETALNFPPLGSQLSTKRALAPPDTLASKIQNSRKLSDAATTSATVTVKKSDQGLLTIPPLEPKTKIQTHREDFLGPTDESNWVLLGRILVGAYPSVVQDDQNAKLLTSVLEQGITTFVCLQQEFQLHGVTEQMWRSGHALRYDLFIPAKPICLYHSFLAHMYMMLLIS